MSLSREERIKAKEQQSILNSVNSPKEEHIGDECSMRVVACAGDPGLSEPFFFDILSRFVICMKEPVSYVPTNNKMFKQFFLVKRPRHLWIDTSGAPDIDESNHHAGTRRKDYLGNLNIGHPSGYSIDTIPQMDTDYTVGQTLQCRKVPREHATDSNIFISSFSGVDFDNYYQNIQTVKTGGQHSQNHGDAGLGIGSNLLNDVMDWTDDHWTSHGGGLSKDYLLTKHAGRGAEEWFKLKPLFPARMRYGAPVKAARAEDEERALSNKLRKRKGFSSAGGWRKWMEDTEEWAQAGFPDNLSGPIVSKPQPRSIGQVGANTFWMILHYYRIDSFMREAFPGHASTISQLQDGDGLGGLNGKGHRYQNDGMVLHPKSLKPVMGKNLFGIVEQTVPVIGEDGKTTTRKQAVGDKRFINKNIPFSFVEWEDTNQGNKQRLNRDDCMPLVIASPNNFPTPKERKIGSIIYEPAYAIVAAAQQDSD